MSELTFEVTRESWLEEVYNHSDSESSRKGYLAGIRKWDEYLTARKKDEGKLFEEMRLKNSDPQTYMLLNDFVQFLKKQDLKPATISITFAALRSWCTKNGVMLFNEYVKKFVKVPKQPRSKLVPLSDDAIRKLVTNASPQVKVVLLVLLSSGMRISECLQVRVSDINRKSTPIEVRLRAKNTKGREERTAYISSEAWDMVEPLLSGKDPEDYVFVKKYTRNMTISFETRFARLRKFLGLCEKYDKRNYHVNIHAFRANFITKGTQVIGGDNAHALAGHHTYLDQYLRLSEKERADNYRKLEPYVTVSDEFRQRKIIAEKEKELSELEKVKDELAKQKAMIMRMKKG